MISTTRTSKSAPPRQRRAVAAHAGRRAITPITAEAPHPASPLGPPNARLEMFNELFEGADDYASVLMEDKNEVYPALLFDDSENEHCICPCKTCGSSKVDREFIENARLLCISGAATIAVMVQESVEEIGKEKTRVLLMHAELPDVLIKRIRKMNFNGFGRFVGFGEPEIAAVTNDSERRAMNILPQDVPTKEMQEAAFAIFEAKHKARI